MVPARLEVGATKIVSLSGETLHFSAISVHTLSGGNLLVSSTPTQTSDFSQLPISLNMSSRQAAARIGPEPMAKNFSPLTSQPAYCEAMHAAMGILVATETSCDAFETLLVGETKTSPSPAKHTSASRRPASMLPVACTPQSMIRVPPSSVLMATQSFSASAVMRLQISLARSLSIGM